MPKSFYIFLVASFIALIPAFFDHGETWKLYKSEKEKRCRHLLKLLALWTIPVLTIIGTIYLGLESLASDTQEKQHETEYDGVTNQLHSATNELASAKNEIGGLLSNVQNLEAKAAQLKAAIPPRKISESQRETIIEVLIDPHNISPKIPIKLFVDSTNQETMTFANRFRKILNESGYIKETNILEIPPVKIHPNDGDNDQAIPDVLGVFCSTNGTLPTTTLPGHFGSIGMFYPEPVVIANGDSKKDNAPRVYRYSADPNDIIYGIMEVLDYVGIRCSTLSPFTNLQPGEVGFFIPKQGG